jgi:hypothetical protein
MKGIKLRAIVGLFCLVLCGAGVLVAHVWKQNAYVRLSMATVRLGKERAGLRNDIALLEVSVGGLRKRGRIEGLAKEHFGLGYGNSPVPVYREAASGQPAESAAKTPGRTARASGSGAMENARGVAIEAGKVAWRTKGL